MTMRSALLRAAAMLLGLAALWARPVGAVGFQYVSVPGPDDRPLDVGIWYPSDTPASAQPRALLPQTVAPDGRLAGRRLPLIVISHGSGGWFGGHVDTALALAEAGYVVAAPTHAGDNYKDTVQFGTVSVLTSRPRQVVRVVDFMLESWAGHDQLDPARIGIFGFSAAGLPPLVAIGAEPNLGRIASYCAENARETECKRATERAAAGTDDAAQPTPIWVHDPRIGAAAIAAPGMGFIFDAASLARVAVPVQLWSGAADDTVRPRSTEIVRQSLPQPPEYHLVENLGHYTSPVPCYSAPGYGKDAPGIDRIAFHRQLNASLVAFFNAQLRSR